MKQGEIIGLKYRILKPIGQGGSSTVYLGENTVLSNPWAIKAIEKDGPSAMDEMREINMLKSLNHPMLPRIADLCEDERYIYIIMDYIEGETLSEVIKAEGKIREPRLTDWAKQLCDVLIYLHSRQPPVIYRDMKPSNIILGKNGRLYLVDFGTAKSYKEQALEDTVYIGTQGYAAPEQFGSGKSDERTDLYNMGMTLFHLATGIHPAQAAHDEIEDILRQNGISHGFSSFINNLVRHDPSKRIGDAGTCLVLLDRMDSPQRPGTASACHSLYAGRLTIGVAGVVHGIGATFTALCLANYFASMGHRTAFVDYCANGDLARLEAIMHRSSRVTYADEKSFVADGITYFRDGRTALGKPARGFGRVLCDFGCLRDEKAVSEFNRSDIRLVICPPADWKLALIDDYIARMSPYDPNREWIYAFPSFGKADKKHIKKTLKTNNVLFFPHISNPYSQNKNEQKSIQAVLKEAMPMSGIMPVLR
jgi:hypothetical protein